MTGAAGTAAAGTAAGAVSPWSVYGTAGGHLLLLTSWNNVSVLSADIITCHNCHTRHTAGLFRHL